MTGFWTGRRVLVTGQTGFKGAWLCLWLERLGAEVSAFALPPHTDPSLYQLLSPWMRQTHRVVDLRDAKAVAKAVGEAKPEIVFHLAAQALVRPAYRDPLETYATNVMGTLHLLLAARDTPSVKAAVIATTDKVYENDSRGIAFKEEDRLGGKDPYSASKACAEILTHSFRYSYLADGKRPAVATVRAGNVVGGGDWSEDRLVCDIVRAFAAGRKVELRYPDAVRPWQHVLEPLRGYIDVAERLVADPSSIPSAFNFGPDPGNWLTVSQIADIMSAALGGKGGWERATGIHPPEAATLTLSSELARRALGWTPRLSMQDTVSWTADWYKAHYAGQNMKAFTLDQIARYEALTKEALTV